MTANQEMFLYWIDERWDILKRREAGQPKPWSTNPVMRETYFCNVNREDDKVTKWIRQNWTTDSTNQYELAMIVARMFNKPETLELIGIPYGRFEVLSDWMMGAHRILKQRQAEGKTVFNGAYIVSTNGKKMNKIDYMFSLFEKAIDEPILNHAYSCEEAHRQLMEIEGLASFMAAQIVADLKNSPGHPLFQAHDKRTFSAFGPGSLRGLGWFYERKISPKDYQEAIAEAMDFVEWELRDEILDVLCMQNLQNCFCEYDKFMRVTNQTGRSKRKYKGE